MNQLQEDFHRKDYLSSDPLEFAHRFEDPMDQEVVALLSAVLAYGNVKQIRRSVEDLLARISSTGMGPSDFVRALQTPEGVKAGGRKLESFVHRFNKGQDILIFLQLVERSWKEYGSVGAHFTHYLSPKDVDITQALNGLMGEWKKWAGLRVPDSFGYLLTAPRDGSCCKRWCMFLRWMGRKDELDLGLWALGGGLVHTFKNGKFLRPAQLIIPIDTHTGRISQYLGLTKRRTMNWQTALEVTQNLRSCDADDPTRYDFALARLGILDLCQRRYRAEICVRCQLQPACKFAHQELPRGSLAS